MWKGFNRISDRRLSLLIALGIPVGILVLFLPVMVVSIYDTVHQGEMQEIRTEMQRAKNIVLRQIDAIDLALWDWAAWDETYRFARGHNYTFVERNLSKGMFENLGIDGMLLLDPEGKTILARFVDHNTQEERPFPFAIEHLLQGYPGLLDQQALTWSKKGMVLVDDQVLLLAARPVLTTDQKGPPQGTLIFFRHFDAHHVEDLERMNLHRIHVYSPAMLAEWTSDLPPYEEARDQVIYEPRGWETGAGYQYLNDFNGSPAMVLSVEMPRALFQQGRRSVMIFSSLFVVVALLLAVGLLFLLRLFLASRRAGQRYLERYRAVVQRSSEAILVVQPDWTIIDANPAAASLLGVRFDPTGPRNLRDLLAFQPEPEEGFLARASREDAATEFHCVRADGRAFDLELVTNQIDDGGSAAYSLNFHDITGRKASEQALRQSEERYRMMFECSPMPMLLYDHQTLAILDVNDTAVSKYGYSREEFKTMSTAEIRPPEDLPRYLEMITGPRNPLRHSTGWRHCRKDGTVMDVEITSHVFGQNGSSSVLIAVHDVTERRRIEREVHLVRDLFSKMFHLSPVPGALVRVRDLVILDINNILEQALGYTREEFVGHAVLEFDLFADPNFVETYLPELTQQRFLHGVEVTFKPKSGGTRQALLYAEIIEQNGEELILVNLIDMTERKQAEQALQESHKRFQSLIENAPDGITVVSADGRLTYASPSTERIMGYAVEEMVGRDPAEFMHPGDLPMMMEVFADIAQSEGKTRTVVYRFHHKDGSLRWIESHVTNLLSEPSINGFVFNYRDITGQKEAQEALEANRRMLAFFVEHAPAGIAMYDRKMTYLAASRRFIEDYRLGDQEVIGRCHYEVFPEVPDRWKEIHQRCLSGAVEKAEKDMFPRADGSIDWTRWEIHPWYEPSGEIGGLMLFAENITERVRSEAALRSKTEEIESLFAVSAHLRKAKTVSEMLPLILDAICCTLEADASGIVLLDPRQTYYTVALASGVLAPNTGWRFPADQGISAEIAHTRLPYVGTDYFSSTRRVEGLQGADQIGPFVVVPLFSESQLLGNVLAARRRGPDTKPFDADCVHLLTAICEMVGTALRRLSLFEDSQRRLSELQALRDIDMTILGTTDVEISLGRIIQHIRTQLQVDAACVFLPGADQETLEYAAGDGFRMGVVQNPSLKLGASFAGRAVLERRIIFIPDMPSVNMNLWSVLDILTEGFIAYYAVPLMIKGQVKGVLEIFHRSPLDENAEWVEFMETLAGQAAIAIDNAGLYRDLQHSNEELVLAYDATIEGWSTALDLRDKETEGHTRRVTELTVRLARSMGISEQELLHVRRGALLHDIGKMGIPDDILLKPGPLTAEEWVVMRKHPGYAYQMLAPILYLRPALDIPYCHHERWDGTGYPRGLRGEEIPLVARIFAVIDVWDALTSDRPYRQAWSRETALEHICRQAGSHFDPHVVSVFLRLVEEVE